MENAAPDPTNVPARLLFALMSRSVGDTGVRHQLLHPNSVLQASPARSVVSVQDAPPRARLRCLTPDRLAGGSATRIELVDESVTLGRAAGNRAVAVADGVSRVHAALVPEPGRWAIRDLGSKNGIAVNLERVTDAPLVHGDIVSIGKLRFRFEVR